jgi:two-component system, OmpR family, sensor histidine kinase BaeS
LRRSIREMPLLMQIWGLHFATTAFVVTAVCLAVDHYGADYLMKIMKQYHFSPTPLHAMFTERLHLLARGAGLLGALVGGVLGFFITQGIVRPLEEIVEVTGRVSAGDRTVQVRGESHTEVGRLGQAFNELVSKLRTREQMEKSLITNVAHELRTPLTNIRGYLEALTDEVLPPSKEIFRSLHEETLLLTKVVESLFALADADAAAGSLQLKDVDLSAVVARTVSICRPQIDAGGLIVEATLEPGTERVVADGNRLVQVLRNLLQNSIEHTGPGGRIRIVTAGEREAISISVEDDGEGIDAADVPFLFDRFFRGQRGGRDHAKHLGLGLAIVKELIEAHGGRVGAEARECGARIWFTLPKRLG